MCVVKLVAMGRLNIGTSSNYINTIITLCSEALVRFPNEEKAKEFVGTLEGGDVVGKLLPRRKKKKVEPMGCENMDESNFAFYNKYILKT